MDLSRARIRPARTPEEVARAAEFLKAPLAKDIALAHPEERGAVRLCEIDGQLVAALVLDPRPLRLRGVAVPCLRILETGGEDGRRRFRRTGERDLFQLVLEEALGYAWVRRYPLVFVHGELALFPAHGFVPCFYHPRVTIDVATALGQPAPYRVRHLKTEDARRLPALHAKNLRSKPLVFASGVPRFHHFCVEGPGRVIRGYLSLEVNPNSTWQPKLFVPEVEVEDRDAARTVLRHCAGEAKKLGIAEMHFPLGPSHPFSRLCLELGGRAVVKGISHDPVHDEEMLHLVDPQRLVAELGPHFRKRLAGPARGLEATVRLATTAGTWALRIGAGQVVCVETPRPEGAPLIPHWQLTQLLAGYRAVGEIDPPLPDGDVEALKAVLPKSWPYSSPDPDHWEAVKPPEPYSPAAEAVVKKTVLPWCPS
ncbi:MAG: hypothetical protein L6Q95_14440 [Planctomycetes bacterium]|nr:hypothetical protein [Planctomycetota bacterium]